MSKLPQRINLRLKDYDYSQAGYYFITICTKDRLGILGKIVVGSDDSVRPPMMQPSKIVEIVFDCWCKINEIYENVNTDSFLFNSKSDTWNYCNF